MNNQAYDLVAAENDTYKSQSRYSPQSTIVGSTMHGFSEEPQAGDIIVHKNNLGQVWAEVLQGTPEELKYISRSIDITNGISDNTESAVDPIQSVILRFDSAEQIFSRPVCQFNVLDPIRDGTGPFHINNHVGFFQAPQGFNIQQAMQQLFRNFPSIFTQNNIARAQFSNCQVNNHPTVKFTADMPGPDLHDDWVFLTNQTSNFFATTLERQWREAWEYAAGPAGGALIPIIGTQFGRIAVDINRRHFLAGRRSWTIGQLPNSNLHFIETAAFERYSHPVFLAAERPMGLRAQILEIWTKFIENYVQSIGATLATHRPSGFQVNRNVAWREQQNNSAQLVRSNTWFPSILARHPGL